MKSAIRPLSSIILLTLTVLGLLNVYGDNADVVKQAEAVACSSCQLRKIEEQRSPIAQKFSFQVDLTSNVTRVTCQRALYLLGDYSCSVTP